MSRNLALLLFVAFVGLFVATGAIYTVDQTRSAIVLELGKPQRVITEPGLHLKVPFVQNVVYFDNRMLDLDMREQEVQSTDQLRLVVDAFARFRIEDPLLAYQTVRSEQGAADKLSRILESRLRDELGKQPFSALLTPERGELMQLIQERINKDARALGAVVVDVRIKRADLPTGAPLEAAFERMRTAREQEARAIRADGVRQAEVIRAGADAETAKVYADSYNRDPEFYAFYRSMQAYRTSLSKDDTRAILSPNSEFLSQFSGRGAR